MVPTFYFANPVIDEKILGPSTRRRAVDEQMTHSSVRSFLVADYFDPMVTTFYGTDVLFWRRVMDEKYIVHLQDVALWMKQYRIHP
jgi:hypothetical protein